MLVSRLLFIILAFLFTGNIFAAELVEEIDGVSIVNTFIRAAREDLLKRKVYSRAYPHKGVTRVVRSLVIHRLFVAENANKKSIDSKLYMLYEHIEKFGMTKLSHKRSAMSARGVMQITKETFEFIRRQYPEAGIGKDFDTEIVNPVTSMKLAFLVVDNAIASIPYEDKTRVMKDDNLLHDYIAAAYNGGPGAAIKLLNKGRDFAASSRGEIKDYIEKVRIARVMVPV